MGPVVHSQTDDQAGVEGEKEMVVQATRSIQDLLISFSGANKVTFYQGHQHLIKGSHSSVAVMGNHTINKGKGQRRALRNVNQREEGDFFYFFIL